MKAEEIRKHWNVVGKYPPEMMSDFALIEIAAQLAEMNQHLAKIANPPMMVINQNASDLTLDDFKKHGGK